jgi:O-6-methylguanine DNA methyltransferase
MVSGTEFAVASCATPIGELQLAATRNGLLRIGLPRQVGAGFARAVGRGLGDGVQVEWLPALDKARSELDEYFRSQRRDFTIELDLRGTDFQLRVWRALREIPYGRTVSYADVSRAIGREGAFRAVGAANGANPVAIVVPCHRVIAADGTLGGYGGGLDLKRRLLALEKSLVSELV